MTGCLNRRLIIREVVTMNSTSLLSLMLLIGVLNVHARPDSAQISSLQMTSESVGPVRLLMTEDELKKLDISYETRETNLEGDYYKQYIFNMAGSASVVATIFDGKVYEVATTSSQFSTGVGASLDSTLKDLMQLYPDGRLISGYADGYYSHFLTADAGGVFVFCVGSTEEDADPTSDPTQPLQLDQKPIEYFVRSELLRWTDS